MTDFYVNPAAVDDSGTGTSWASAKKYIQSVTTAVAGDTVYVGKSPDPVAVGSVTASWYNGNYAVPLSRNIVRRLEAFESGFIAGTGISLYHESSWAREGTNLLRLVTSTSCPTGIFDLASKDYGSDQNWQQQNSKDLTQISVWYNTSSPFAAGDIEIRLYDSTNNLLCSFPLPACNSSSSLVAYLLTAGAALPSNVRKLAITWVRATKIPSGRTLKFDHLIGCFPSDDPEFIWLGSLIGNPKSSCVPGSDGTNYWYPIQSFPADNQIVIDTAKAFIMTTRSGYSGTASQINAQLYRRETFMVSTAQSVYCGGGLTAETRIRYSGGWDFSGSPVQNGETWLDAMYLGSVATFTANKQGIEVDRINSVRGYNGTYLGGNNSYFHDIQTSANSWGFSLLSSTGARFENLKSSGAGYYTYSTNPLTTCTLENIENAGACSNGQNSFSSSGTLADTHIRNLLFINCSTPHLYFGGGDADIYDSTIPSISVAGVSKVTLVNCVIPAPTISGTTGTYVSSIDHNGSPGSWKAWIYSSSAAASLAFGSPASMGTSFPADMISFACPTTAISYLPYYIPVRAGAQIRIRFVYQRSVSAYTEPDIYVEAWDNDWKRTKLINYVAIPSGSQGVATEYLSPTITPTSTGLIKFVLSFKANSAMNPSIGIREVGVIPQVFSNFGSLDVLVNGLPSNFLASTQIEHSYAF